MNPFEIEIVNPELISQTMLTDILLGSDSVFLKI